MYSYDYPRCLKESIVHVAVSFISNVRGGSVALCQLYKYNLLLKCSNCFALHISSILALYIAFPNTANSNKIIINEVIMISKIISTDHFCVNQSLHHKGKMENHFWSIQLALYIYPTIWGLINHNYSQWMAMLRQRSIQHYQYLFVLY